MNLSLEYVTSCISSLTVPELKLYLYLCSAYLEAGSQPFSILYAEIAPALGSRKDTIGKSLRGLVKKRFVVLAAYRPRGRTYETGWVRSTAEESVPSFFEPRIKLRHLDGTATSITRRGVGSFCRKYGISRSHFAMVLAETRKSVKGWMLEEVYLKRKEAGELWRCKCGGRVA